jgi:purine nucleosidase
MWGRPPNADIVVGTDPVRFFDRMIARIGDHARTVYPGEPVGEPVGRRR